MGAVGRLVQPRTPVENDVGATTPSVDPPQSTGCPAQTAVPAVMCSSSNPGNAPCCSRTDPSPAGRDAPPTLTWPHRHLRLLRQRLLTARFQLPPLARTHGHLPLHLQPLGLLPFVDPLVPGVAPNHRLAPVQQIVRLRNVVRVDRRRAQAVDYPRLRIPSGSRSLFRFLVDGGASMMVASTMVPSRSFSPRDSR